MEHVPLEEDNKEDNKAQETEEAEEAPAQASDEKEEEKPAVEDTAEVAAKDDGAETDPVESEKASKKSKSTEKAEE